MATATSLLLAVMPALVIAGGLHDLLTMKIPNWISGVLVIAFFPIAFVIGLSPMAVAVHLGVGLAVLLIGMGMFALRWLGGGDVKLMAAACLWLGLTGSGMFLLYTGVVGGLFCLALMFARAYAQPYVMTAPGWVTQLMQPKGDIPYGVAIAIGALIAWPASPLVVAFTGG